MCQGRRPRHYFCVHSAVTAPSHVCTTGLHHQAVEGAAVDDRALRSRSTIPHGTRFRYYDILLVNVAA